MLFFCDLAEARTQDPLLKREMLYQLSYQVFRFKECKYSSVFQIAKTFLVFFETYFSRVFLINYRTPSKGFFSIKQKSIGSIFSIHSCTQIITNF